MNVSKNGEGVTVIASKKLKVTFKKHPRETGLARIGNPHPPVDIKIGGRVVGYISPRNHMNHFFKVRFMVETEDKWKWITLKKDCETEEEARELAKKFVELKPETPFRYMED